MKILLVLSALLISSTAFAAGTPNLTGQWTVNNSIAGNESGQDCKFIQTENKLTGSCKDTEKEFQVTGSIEKNKVTWTYQSEYNGTPLTLTYTGALDDSSKIAGSVEVSPFGVTGDFTSVPSKKANK